MRTILISIILLAAFAFQANAQNTDSLFNVYMSHHHTGINKSGNQIQSSTAGDKCGFGLSNTIRQHITSFSAGQQAVLLKVLERPELETSIVSPEGLFRIHYNLAGSNAPKYFDIAGKTDAEIVQMSVDSLAAAFDNSYDFEVNYLGYQSPLIGDNLGGDDLYDVYIINMGFYGETTTDAGSASSYIKIDNDFVGSGFYTTGIEAAKVTAAHEFHHGIQLAHYGYYDTETEFYEMTSTAMEEFVYDEVNDYYAYMNSYFTRPYNTFKSFSGYDLAAFYLYLYQKYAAEGDGMTGHNIIKNAWEIFATSHSDVDAISSSLFQYGSSMKSTWNDFGIWCYFTNNRTISRKYFEEAINYPLARPFSSYEFNTPSKEYSFNTKPISNNYIIFEINSENFTDTLVSIITNADTENGKASPYTTSDVYYKLTTTDESGAYNIVNDYYSLLTADQENLFMEGNIFNNEVVSGSTISREVVDYAFPQPFHYSKYSSILIPTEPNSLGFAYLNIYTTSMNLVYDDKKDIINGNKIIVQWNGLDNDGNRLPTGIYIFVTKSDDNVKKGKLVIYND